MTSLTIHLDNVDVSENLYDSSEQITKLFAKCRPRSDVNLNPIIVPGRDHDRTDNSIMNIERDSDRSVLDRSGSDSRDRDETLDEEKDHGGQVFDGQSTDDDFNDDIIVDHTNSKENQVIILPRNTGSYKLRDSRIIEIAGGREIFSQSRSKAARKSRYISSGEESSERKKTQKSPLRQGVWEFRGSRCGEAKKLKNSREFTETVFSSEVCSVRHQRSEQPQQQQQPPPPHQQQYDTNINRGPTNMAVVSGNEVVVFDDIGDTWQVQNRPDETVKPNNADAEINSSDDELPSMPPFNHTASDFFNATASDMDDSPTADSEQKVTKVIGNLPIAVYEGSPRRYGPRQVDSSSNHPQLPSAHSLLASPSVYPPRPGFPQRVVTTPNENENADIPTIETESPPPAASTFDYLYEFSETRKVLEEFFKCPPTDEENPLEAEFQDLEYELRRQSGGDSGSSYVGQRLAKGRSEQNEFCMRVDSPRKQNSTNFLGLQDHEIIEHENNFLDLSVGTGSSGDLGETEVGLQVGHSRNFTLSPETTDCDSNCGDLDSEVSSMHMENELGPSVGLLGSSGDLGMPTDSLPLYSSMPVLEDGLSSGHASDTDNNNPTVMLMKRQITEIEREIIQRTHGDVINKHDSGKLENGMSTSKECLTSMKAVSADVFNGCMKKGGGVYDCIDLQVANMDPLAVSEMTPPPPAPAPHRSLSGEQPSDVEAAIKDIRLTLQRTKTLPLKSPPEEECEENASSPIWVPRQRGLSGTSGDSDRKVQSGEEGGDEEEADTDLETDRLLGQQRTDDQGFYDDKGWRKPKTRTIMPPNSLSKAPAPKQIIPTTPSQQVCDGPLPSELPLALSSPPGSPRASDATSDKSQSPESQKGSTSSIKPKKDKETKKKGRNKEGLWEPSVLIEGVLFRARYLGSTQLVCEGQPTKTTRMMQAEEAVSRIKEASNQMSQNFGHCGHSSQGSGSYDDDTPVEDDDDETVADRSSLSVEPTSRVYPMPLPLGVGATGTVFRLHFLGSVEVEEEGGRKRRKRLKKNMVEEAVTKIKAPDGETQPSTEVDLFISTEKIMVLNTDLKEIMMDHALPTISYIADIGDLVVLMARRRFVPHEMEEPPKINRTPKMICHVFESEEAQFIAQSIGQAFQVAYMEFLKANGIEDHTFGKEMDYQEVLNSQEIFGDELQMFAKKEMQKEVVVPKAKGEILGVVIVESGWGSMLPTVVIANLSPAGAAARCGQLNIGDQIIAINGISLVGLPLSTCQNYIKNSKNQTVVKLTVVPCTPVVQVKIKRPDTKYQLGFSVQNGVICSLLRGGIAERGGVRVGHRIIEINNKSAVAVPHEEIVNLLATSVGEILMKTMPTSMFRLVTGQENPVYI